MQINKKLLIKIYYETDKIGWRKNNWIERKKKNNHGFPGYIGEIVKELKKKIEKNLSTMRKITSKLHIVVSWHAKSWTKIILYIYNFFFGN